MPPPTPENATLILVVFALLIGAIIAAWSAIIIRLALGLAVLPREKPRIVPWGGLSVFFVALAWLAILVFVPVTYYLVQGGPPGAKAQRPPLSPGEMMTLSGLQNLVTLLTIPLLLAATSGASLRDFGVKLDGFRQQVFRGMVAYPLIAPLIFGVMAISVLSFGRDRHPLENAIQNDRSPGMAVILITAGVVLAPLAEELIFRGVLLGWLTKVALGVRKPRPGEVFEIGDQVPIDQSNEPTAEVFDLPETPTQLIDEPGQQADWKVGERAEDARFPDFAPPRSDPDRARPGGKVLSLALANVAVSIIFAGLHAAVWPTPIPLFFFSLGLGMLYQQSGSIIGPVVLHMMFNGVSTLIMFLAVSSTPPAPPAPQGGPKLVGPVKIMGVVEDSLEPRRIVLRTKPESNRNLRFGLDEPKA